MNIIKLCMARGEVEIIQLRLIVETRPHFMEASMKVGLNKAAKLIQRLKRPRVRLYSLLSSGIVARGTTYALRHLAPWCNPSSIVAHRVIPAVHPINIIAMKPQESLAITRRR
ncbi:hypothetical protein FHS16_003422 [Paenibacillus endophyticus]|uniref:Uncharacterized protein n=1 Tax=Paenibacillus endophyticus TaxID=1294268 RepID=A0A7W5C9V3_9BACL|nr:hypothetical protein [Paenibacillus endophyticus]MBB3153360.1 hypothetical protein [Paenibacillus endophyticus]